MHLSQQTLMPLAEVNLPQLANNQNIFTPDYDRENTEIGIVHLGPGAFHRAHQAVYTENAMNIAGGNWGICGVSLRSNTARDVLAAQDNLYTLAILDEHISYQVIGAIKEILVASEQSNEVITRMSAQSTKLVTLTITEKGYCLAADGSLDLHHPDIAHDLLTPASPVSAIGFIVEALKQRKLKAVTAFNVLSCDNVSGNGDKLRRAVLDYAEQLDSGLQMWITQNVAFPNAMVDSITPKTERYTIESVAAAINQQDNWPIQREAFSQWVIDSNWQGERPDWEKVGVIFTDNVEGFEQAKLRLLNGLHSTLAYAGLLAGFESVFNVTSDKRFHRFITQLASEEIIGSFVAPKELDTTAYANQIITRFLNPEIQHLLTQIAFDGSQKIQMRLLPVIADNLALGRPITLLCLSLACWFEFICREVKSGTKINDPMASQFAKMPALLSENSQDVVDGFLNIGAIFNPALKENNQLKVQLVDSLTLLRQDNINNIEQIIEKLGSS